MPTKVYLNMRGIIGGEGVAWFSLAKSELREKIMAAGSAFKFGSPPFLNLTCRVTSSVLSLFFQARGLSLRDKTG